MPAAMVAGALALGCSFAAVADPLLDQCQGGDPAARILACTQLIDSGRESADFLPTLRGLRGVGYFKSGDYANAIPDLTAALRIKKDKAFKTDVLKMRGVAYHYAGDYPHALADFDEIIRLGVEPVEGRNDRAYTNLKTGKFTAAAADYDLVLKAQPNRPAALYGRGLAKRGAGESAAARLDIDRAVSLQADIAAGFIQDGLESAP